MIIAVFIPAVNIFQDYVDRGEDARLVSEARKIATAANEMDGEGAYATLQISVPCGRIEISAGQVRAVGNKADKSFAANVANSLTLGEGSYNLKLGYGGGGVWASL